MKFKTPHIITETNTQFHIGKKQGKYILYDFERILEYLNFKGKLLFGEKFEIYEEDREILFKLCIYFINDCDYARKLDLDLNKGLLLTGPIGCGKTSLMKLMPNIVPYKRRYQVVPTRSIVFNFNHNGFSTIEHYGNEGFYCFDDLGVEPTGRYYGKDCNVMGEVLLSRYDLLCHPVQSRRITTHITTNLNAQELEENYGNRVRSRMRELFNLVAFDCSTTDKRN